MMVDYGKTIVNNSKIGNKTVEMTKEQFAHFNKFLDELKQKRKEFLESSKANDDSEYWRLRGEIEKKYAGKFPIDRMTLMHLPQYALDEIRKNAKIVNNSKVGNKTIEMTKKEYDNFISCIRDLDEIGKLFKPNVPTNENAPYYDARSKLERKYKGKFPIDISLFTLDELKRFKPDVKVANDLSSDIIKRDIESFKKWLNRIDETINFVGKIENGRDYMKLYSRKYEDIATPMKSMIQPHWEDPNSVKKFKDNMIKDLKLFRHSKELLLKELEADLKEALKREK